MAAKGRERCGGRTGGGRVLRIFVHYPPQFYHFHVHFTNVSVDVGVSTERAHLLDDIIENLERTGALRQVLHHVSDGRAGRAWRRYREAKAAGGGGDEFLAQHVPCVSSHSTANGEASPPPPR